MLLELLSVDLCSLSKLDFMALLRVILANLLSSSEEGCRVFIAIQLAVLYLPTKQLPKTTLLCECVQKNVGQCRLLLYAFMKIAITCRDAIVMCTLKV